MFKLGLTGSGALATASMLGPQPQFAQAATLADTTVQTSPDTVKAALTKIEALATAEIKSGSVPGLAMAVVYQDKVVYAKGFGLKDAGKAGTANTAANMIDTDTVFQLASVSKPIGATLVSMLVGEGAVSWDSRIADLDPDFAMYDPWVTHEITIRDMYCHRSGLPAQIGDLLEDLEYPREEILHRLRYQRLNSSFRSKYAYTNFGMTAAAIAATKAVNLTWEDAIEQKLYKPLGMNNTSSRYADFVACKNRALGHVLAEGKWVAKYKRDADTESPAGGVSSTVNDMAKWIRLELANGKFEGKQLVAESALAETRFPHTLRNFNAAGLPNFYGLGWNVDYQAQGKLRLNHAGAFALGAGTSVYLVPDQSLGIVVLSNAQPTGVAEALCASFLDYALIGTLAQDWLSVFKTVFGQMMADKTSGDAKYATPPEQAEPALSNDAYVGTYTNNYFGDIVIAADGDGLTISQGPKPLTFVLTHWSRDTFIYPTEGESSVGLAGVTFTVDTEGKASSVRVENLDIYGNGTFVRNVVA